MKLDDIKKLHQKKYREDFGFFLVEGEHLILELQKAAQQNAQWAKSTLLATEKYANWNTLFPLQIISEKQMAQISDTKTPQGIIAVVPLPTTSGLHTQSTFIKSEAQSAQAIYLYEIQDPGNLGTILRTLAWFGNFTCLLSPGSVDPFNPKVVRASMGAIFYVPLEFDVDIDSLTSRFTKIAALDIQGKKLSSSGFKDCDCFLFGNEARGLPREKLVSLAAQTYSISGSGAIESLNLASAVNMCVYELARS